LLAPILKRAARHWSQELGDIGTTKLYDQTSDAISFDEIERIESSFFYFNLSAMKILLLASNPTDTTRLRLDEEAREIDAGLRRARLRDKFELVQRWAVRVRDIRQAMLDESPQIVHFSGHGEMEGLVFEDQSGQSQVVEKKALAGLFELFQAQVECVLLNACYSAPQANAIGRHIPYVIGMKKEVGDQAAIEFAVGFYEALGAGRSIEDAFKFGRNAIEMQGIPEDLTPVLHKGAEMAKVP
jgi:hypothetical protein